MNNISLKDANDRLKEAQNDYCEASFLEKSAKGEEKNLLQNKMEAAIIRTKIIFDDCPELSNIVDDFSFSPNYFKSDLNLLISKLSTLNFEE